MKDVRALVSVSLAAAALLACGSDPVGQTGDPQLTLSRDSVVLDVGASASVTATVRNTSEAAQFVSRDEGVATVKADGAISGVGVGSTYVVATLAGHADVRDSLRVRVKAYVPDPCAVQRPEFGVAPAAERGWFAYDAAAPLNLQKTVEVTTTAVERSGILYDSPAGGLVSGILVEPVGRTGLRPGIVLMHPSGVNARGMAPYAELLAQHGAVVIAIDAPYFRRGGNGFLLFTTQDRDEHVQLIKDLQRAVDVLLTREHVDPARIGFEGYSLGGMIGAHFVGIERRLKAAVLAAAFGGHVTGATNAANLPYLASLSCDVRNAWLQAMTPIEPIRFIPHASPTALLFQMGRFDTAVPLSDAQALFEAAPLPKEARLYDTGHGLNQQALWDRHDWLHAQLGIDPRS
jgi:uncharacterized protein